MIGTSSVRDERESSQITEVSRDVENVTVIDTYTSQKDPDRDFFEEVLLDTCRMIT